MCQIIETITIKDDGRQHTSQETIPCPKAPRRGLCKNITTKKTEYYPGASAFSSRAESPASNGPFTPPSAGGPGDTTEIHRPTNSRGARRPSILKPEIVIEIGGRKGNTKFYPKVPRSSKRSSLASTHSNEAVLGSPGSEKVVTGFPDAPLPPTGYTGQSESYNFRHAIPQGHRHTSSSSSHSTSQVPSLTLEPESPTARLSARYPPALVHNPIPAAPPSPATSRAHGPSSATSSKGNYRTETAMPQFPLDYDDFLPRPPASFHASSGHDDTPETTSRAQYREERRRAEKKRQQEEHDRHMAEELNKEFEKEEKTIRFADERDQSRSEQRNESLYAESQKYRAQVREETRQKLEGKSRKEEKSSKKEGEKRAIRKPERIKTKLLAGLGRTRRRSSITMTQEDKEQLERLRRDETNQQERKRVASDGWDREEQLSLQNPYATVTPPQTLRQQQETVEYYNPRSSGSGKEILDNDQEFAARIEDRQKGKRELKVRSVDGPTYDSSSEDSSQPYKDEMRISLPTILEEDDNSSIASSSDGSIFSIQSLASPATDLSKTSGYSALQIATATQKLILILQDDEVLRPLYTAAIRSDIIGPQRFANNFRRLLKRYSENLKDEARDRLDYLAAQLVALKARHLAESILEKFLGDTVAPKPTRKETDESVRKDDSSDGEDSVIDESIFQDLIIVREFLVESNAFQILRSQLRQFVLPPKSTTKRQVKQSKDPSDEALMNHANVFTPKVHFVLERVLNALLLQLGISEPPCPPQKKRVRWKCKCGKSGFYDVIEQKPGGASELQHRIKRAIGVNSHSTLNFQGNSNRRQPFQTIWAWVQGAFGKCRRRPNQTPTLPQHHAQPTSATQGSQTPAVQQRSLHMMSCVHKGRYGKNLFQDRIETVNTDQELFVFMKEQFMKHRGKIISILSLRTVQGIFFSKFRLSLGGNVEIRSHEPCCASRPCECLPPKAKVEPSPRAEYRCVPGPPLTYPPVLPDYLMHLFISPSCINENETWILDQLPRRTCGKLHGKSHEPAEGWGIYYQEGWNRDIIAWIVAVLFLLGSLIFGVLWSKFKMDIQGAFGVSAWWVAVCGILMALVATRADNV